MLPQCATAYLRIRHQSTDATTFNCTSPSQWEGLIAVNYPARARGVTRHMRVHEAKAACPELRLAHVQTIGASCRSSQYVLHVLVWAILVRR